MSMNITCRFHKHIRLFSIFVIMAMSTGYGQTLPQYLNFSTEITKSAELDYLLYVPADYHPSQGKPLLIFLTGEEFLGDINLIRSVGPPAEVEAGMSFDYFIVAPQLPGDVLWDTEVLLALIDQLNASYHIENTQVWVTGLGDRGGWGAWELVLLYPELFKKFAPVASSPGTNVWQAHELSTWIFHGALDEVVPVEDAEIMYYELNWDEVDVQLTVFDTLGHDIGDQVYSNPAFYQWLSGETPQYGSASPSPLNRSLNASVVKSIDDDYLLYLPVGYDSNQEDWPLLIYLHGSGSAIWDLDAIRDGGPPQLFEEGMDSDFILLCPQLHADVHWDVDRIHALSQEILDNYRVDESRVYLTGLSRGGFGAWEFGVSYPNMFAGIVPISARDVAGVERLIDNNVWIFHGDQDTGVPWQGSQLAYNRLNSVGANVHFTLYAGVGHWAWEPAYATEGLWVWLMNQENDRVSIADPKISNPVHFLLNQNYPNPFNQSTVIKFVVSSHENVRFEVFNTRGQGLMSILKSSSPSGQHEVEFDAEDLPSGIYLYKISAGEYSQTKKMILIK